MKCLLKVYRGSPGNRFREEFLLTCTEQDNVISLLMQIQKNPVNAQGKATTPVAWEMGCLEEVCGSCSMLINGHPRQACTALIPDMMQKDGSITLAPFTKFPLVRDLIVDRSSMFEHLKTVHAWIDANPTQLPHLTISQEVQDVRYQLSTCMTCGCCSESCPQVNEKSAFMGPAPLSQVRLFNAHPIGRLQRAKRLEAVSKPSGVIGCGNAQNCVRVCPKNIPLTESIATLFRDTLKEGFRKLFNTKER